MSREIKFRAYDQFNDCFYYSEKLGMKEFWRHVSELNEAGNNVVVDQYTGFMDSKGLEIYEGDILSRRGVPNVSVGFLHGSFIVRHKDEKAIWTQELRLVVRHAEVIGNIHQNPELLNP